MTISDVSSVSAGQTSVSQTSSGTSAVSSDFETFLKMMTVQMQNQDPLNPVESTDFAVQLATFSQVEQQVQTNEHLESLASAIGGAGLASRAQLIGRSVLSAGGAEYDGGTLAIVPEYGALTGSHILVVRDEDGAEVGRRVLDGAPEQINWNGTTDSGYQVPVGLYTFAIESYVDDELVSTMSALTWGVIQEVQTNGADTTLVLESGETLYESEVSSIR